MIAETFVHIRPPTVPVVDRKGETAQVYPTNSCISIAYRYLPADADGKWVSIGIAFCAPQEKAWVRKKSCAIARGRLNDSPLRLRFEGLEAPLASHHVVSAVRAVVIENPVWEMVDDQVLRPGRFTQRWGSPLMGPDGSLLTAYFDFKHLLRGIPRGHCQLPRPVSHWILKTPSWAKSLLRAG